MPDTDTWNVALAKLIHDALLPVGFDEDDHMTAVQTLVPALLAKGRMMRVDPVDDSLMADAIGWENIANPFERVLVLSMESSP